MAFYNPDSTRRRKLHIETNVNENSKDYDARLLIILFFKKYNFMGGGLNFIVNGVIPKSSLEAFLLYDLTHFLKIDKLLIIICTLPVSTATLERTFLTVKRVKTFLRNTMGQVKQILHLLSVIVFLLFFLEST